jgi:transcription elongation factor SPT4
MSQEEDVEPSIEFEAAQIPQNLKGLRACLGCSLVKNYEQFYDSGCENCEWLQIEDSNDRVRDCTTPYFEGCIALVEPKNSWVGRWQQISSFIPGMYAVQLVGELPAADIAHCKQNGLPYRSSSGAMA